MPTYFFKVRGNPIIDLGAYFNLSKAKLQTLKDIVALIKERDTRKNQFDKELAYLKKLTDQRNALKAKSFFSSCENI